MSHHLLFSLNWSTIFSRCSLHWFLSTPSSAYSVKQYNTHIRHFVNARRHYTSKWIETKRQYNNRPVYIHCSEKYGYALINTALFQRDSLVACFWYICQFFALLCVFRFQFFVKEPFGFKTCSQCCLSFQAHRKKNIRCRADITGDNEEQYQKRANTIKFNREVHRSE